MSGAVVPMPWRPEVPGKVNPSSLPVIDECAGSAALPFVRETAEIMERGRMIHEFAELAVKAAPPEVVEKLLASLPVDVAKTCRRINRAALLRIALGGRDGEGPPKTEVLRETHLRGGLPVIRWKADAMHLTADGTTLVVTDWKSGDGWVEGGEDSDQVTAYAVCAVEDLRLQGAGKIDRLETVLLQTVAIRSSGALFPLPFVMNMEAVQEERKRLEATLERVLWARRDAAKGKPPLLTVGPHCGRCRSLPYCPAQRASALILAESDTEAVALAERLTTTLKPEYIAGAWMRLRAFEAAAGVVRSALVEQIRAAGGSVPTSDTKELRIIPVHRETVDPMIAMSELLAEVEAGDAAKAFEVSKAGIARALAGDEEKAEEVLARIRDRGGISTSESEMVREVKRRG